jgi:hypothetical protein
MKRSHRLSTAILASLQITYMNRALGDKKFEAGLEKLISDYQDLLKT